MKKWNSFIGLFDSIIHQNTSLAPVQKLQYLMNYLEGEARDTIAHIPLSNENYESAFGIIKRKYTNERKICDDYVTNLLDLPKMTNRSAQGILNIMNILNISIHGLRSYNFHADTWHPIIVNCVTRKLDEESRQKFEEQRHSPRKMPTIPELMEFLDNRYQVLLSDVHYQRENTIKKKALTTIVTDKPNAQPDQPKRCSCCQSNNLHPLRLCETFNKFPVPKRVQFVKSNKRCFNCLSLRHQLDQCTSRFTCAQCKGRHNSLLCDAVSTKPSPKTSTKTESPKVEFPRTAATPKAEVSHVHFASKRDDVAGDCIS